MVDVRDDGHHVARGDCHGEAKTKALMGKVRLPYEYFEHIQAALGK